MTKIHLKTDDTMSVGGTICYDKPDTSAPYFDPSLYHQYFSSQSYSYLFTTENINDYYKNYDFNHKKVLTVVGSGDHVLEAFLRGASEVDSFDISENAIRMLNLKIAAIKVLTLDEYVEYLCDLFYLGTLEDYLTVDSTEEVTEEERKKCLNYILELTIQSSDVDKFVERLINSKWRLNHEMSLNVCPKTFADLKDQNRIVERTRKSKEKFSRISQYLSEEDRIFWQSVYEKNNFKEIINHPLELDKDNHDYMNRIYEFTSYMTPENYLTLQSRLLRGEYRLRTFCCDVSKIPGFILSSNKSGYDYMFFSNIFDYQKVSNESKEKYYDLMRKCAEELTLGGIIIPAYCYGFWAHYYRVEFSMQLPNCTVESFSIPDGSIVSIQRK